MIKPYPVLEITEDLVVIPEKDASMEEIFKSLAHAAIVCFYLSDFDDVKDFIKRLQPFKRLLQEEEAENLKRWPEIHPQKYVHFILLGRGKPINRICALYEAGVQYVEMWTRADGTQSLKNDRREYLRQLIERPLQDEVNELDYRFRRELPEPKDIPEIFTLNKNEPGTNKHSTDDAPGEKNIEQDDVEYEYSQEQVLVHPTYDDPPFQWSKEDFRKFIIDRFNTSMNSVEDDFSN